ncbi:MAG: hypothetical protein WD733_22155 [Bryobacterales bacterium]
MKTTLIRLAVLAALAAPVWGQGLSVGVRGGVPLSDAFEAVPGALRFRNVPHRWTAGPTIEVRLPLSLGITFDALYSRVEYELDDGSGRQRGGQWDFPLMLRYRAGIGPVRPFIAGGGSFNKITDITTPKSTVAGLVLGAGVEVKVPLVRITPEVRYTRRFDDAVSLDGLRSNRNQFLFLTGITF